MIKRYGWTFAVGIALFVMTFACGRADVGRQLDLADSLLDSNPDSALSVIDNIDPALINTEEEYARCGQIRFASLVKTGNMPDSDTLLIAARKRYGSSEDHSREKMLTGNFCKDLAQKSL